MPSRLVLVLRLTFVASLTRVTEAFASTAPFASFTAPRKVALPVVWASATEANRQRHSANAVIIGSLKSRSDRADVGLINFFIFIYPPTVNWRWVNGNLYTR